MSARGSLVVFRDDGMAERRHRILSLKGGETRRLIDTVDTVLFANLVV